MIYIFEDNIDYDMINKILEEIKINDILINRIQYNKEICVNNFNKSYNNKESNIKKASLILGGVVGVAGLTFLSIPTIFGISVLGPISGGLFAYLQSISITLSIIQSITTTGVSIAIGTCCISGASIIILPGLVITYKDIKKNKEIYHEIQKYIIEVNIKNF